MSVIGFRASRSLSIHYVACDALEKGSVMATQNESILRNREVRARTGLSRSTIWRLERSGQFPQRVQLSANAVGYRQSEIQDWIERRRRVEGGEI
jgi:prophage regulatory protein